MEIVATLAREPLDVAFRYWVIKRYEIPMEGRLNFPVAELPKQL
jgi:hypothetical protein